MAATKVTNSLVLVFQSTLHKAEPNFEQEILFSLPHGTNWLGRYEVNKLFGVEEKKLSRKQIEIGVAPGLLYDHVTLKMVGTNISILERFSEFGGHEKFQMEKDRAYNMHPGDVLYLLRDQYPFKLEERTAVTDEPQAQPDATANIPVEDPQVPKKKKPANRASGSLSKASILLKSLPDIKKSIKEERNQKKRPDIISHSDVDIEEMKSSLASLRTVAIERDSAHEAPNSDPVPHRTSKIDLMRLSLKYDDPETQQAIMELAKYEKSHPYEFGYKSEENSNELASSSRDRNSVHFSIPKSVSMNTISSITAPSTEEVMKDPIFEPGSDWKGALESIVTSEKKQLDLLRAKLKDVSFKAHSFCTFMEGKKQVLDSAYVPHELRIDLHFWEFEFVQKKVEKEKKLESASAPLVPSLNLGSRDLAQVPSLPTQLSISGPGGRIVPDSDSERESPRMRPNKAPVLSRSEPDTTMPGQPFGIKTWRKKMIIKESQTNNYYSRQRARSTALENSLSKSMMFISPTKPKSAITPPSPKSSSKSSYGPSSAIYPTRSERDDGLGLSSVSSYSSGSNSTQPQYNLPLPQPAPVQAHPLLPVRAKNEQGVMSLNLPLFPGFHLEIEKVLEFQMKEETKESLLQLKKLAAMQQHRLEADKK